MVKVFKHLKSGKTMYAVTGINNDAEAFDMVRKYKKINSKDFQHDHKICDGTIYNKNLYVGVLDYKKATPCKIVYRNTIDLSEFK